MGNVCVYTAHTHWEQRVRIKLHQRRLHTDRKRVPLGDFIPLTHRHRTIRLHVTSRAARLWLMFVVVTSDHVF